MHIFVYIIPSDIVAKTISSLVRTELRVDPAPLGKYDHNLFHSVHVAHIDKQERRVSTIKEATLLINAIYWSQVKLGMSAIRFDAW